MKDLAFAHVQAALIPEAGNRRFIISAGQISSQEISDILRSNFPELADRIPKGKPGTSSLPEKAYSADSTPAVEILGVRFHITEETLVTLAKELLEIERSSLDA
ncbi:MAG: hypothetical protein Q9165_001335 [Trypethelium subeluteriae]